MSNKRKKARRKRWLRNRVKTYRRTKFKDAFRSHFVDKGILTEK